MAPVGYDPARPIFVSFDFNVEPATALLGQELSPGEYSHVNKAHGAVLGLCGEFYRLGGMDAEAVATSLLQGNVDGVRMPDNFRGLIEHKSFVHVYGDATGNARRVEAKDAGTAWGPVSSVLSENLAASRPSSTGICMSMRIRSTFSARQRIHRFPAVFGGDHLPVAAAQEHFDQLAHHWVILRQQNSWRSLDLHRFFLR